MAYKSLFIIDNHSSDKVTNKLDDKHMETIGTENGCPLVEICGISVVSVYYVCIERKVSPLTLVEEESEAPFSSSMTATCWCPSRAARWRGV